MTMMRTHISWTDTTWNPTTGCNAISPGCLHCYAKAMTDRLFGGNFEDVKLHPDRLGQVARFGPIKTPYGPRPRMVFVNSMSDLFHKDIPDSFRDQVFDAMEGAGDTVFQVLTKRATAMRRYVEARYGDAFKPGGKGVPPHIWFGVSVEDGPRAVRIDQLRLLKRFVGSFTAFLSVEPLIGDPASHDYRWIDQVLIGGESGPGARPCDADWIRRSIERARDAGAAVWFKQFGHWRNNPLYQRAAGSHLDRIRAAIAAGEVMATVRESEKAPGKFVVEGEKGGATIDGRTYRELPTSYAVLTEALRRRSGLLAA